ncbi:EAL and HDOD domain-containing protein [Megalodesulfovibrio gigas]|uniref:Putative diguanylate phosphodiesterase n=1 Tax=Megalodesulfovibrio gigas (strain ATCC 19364 / DSM 1382 / NCIMB 9332 / VKM B-1759) TaxID=1121448 RepID=T2GCN9_MEGG1|nr:HDOD domain-containing protein [Megalodesulfovibrio gigas]AGW13896.1 putative diguanylate phosphodiesterase [Megalodesulfovibrio gigas DSM 1382 = ATCC 19364]
MEILANHQAFQSIFVARQAIYDRNGKVYAYKLLFRDSAEAQQAVFDDPDKATAQIIADGYALARHGVRPELPLLITLPPNLLRKEIAMALPPEQTIIQVMDAKTPDRTTLNACALLKEAGFTIALSLPSYAALIELADIVSLDLRGREDGDVIKMVQRLSGFSNLHMMVEKVEDKRTFQMARSAGFHYFQGYFFARPMVVPGRKLQPAAAAKIQLIQEVSKEDFELTALSRIIGADPSLSLRLLHFINSASMARTKKVESISQAVTLLGQRPLRQWLMAVLLADMNQTAETEELYYMSVQRARFLELLAECTTRPPLPKDALMLVGLFSKLDALLRISMEEILNGAPLDDAVRATLLGTHAASQWLTLSEAVEDGRWADMQQTLTTFGLSPVKAAVAYNKASVWASELLQDTQLS